MTEKEEKLIKRLQKLQSDLLTTISTTGYNNELRWLYRFVCSYELRFKENILLNAMLSERRTKIKYSQTKLFKEHFHCYPKEMTSQDAQERLEKNMDFIELIDKMLKFKK